MSYPPPPQGQDPNNPYGQQQPPGYGYQQAPQGVPPQGQPGYGYPQQGQPMGPPMGQPQYGYPQQPGYGYNPVGAPRDYAGWGSRVGGTIVDGLIAGVPYGVLALAGFAMGDSGMILVVLGVLVYIGVMLWMLYQEGTTGQSPGKKMVNVRLVKESTGQPIGFGMAFLRKLAHILDSLACYLGWLWPLWDAKSQTFADKVCGTVVVTAN
ncbi:RDD family protein [Streptomyces sp. N2-109]|uniref:RDD family protein n=1 Tax=Streptomyces gossypii TaxID=2883101 RepID=A0ABT2K4W8_9ACTN|nr:RDD family protein [Streptomyces gossypii]MCT2594534.1 RDD family protein [Streptomyces gossypii]